MTDVAGTLTYSPVYSDHVLSDASFSFTGKTMDVIGIIAPVSFDYSAGGSGGSSLSPTLASVISIIPLLMAVGIVIGAITMFKMRS